VKAVRTTLPWREAWVDAKRNGVPFDVVVRGTHASHTAAPPQGPHAAAEGAAAMVLLTAAVDQLAPPGAAAAAPAAAPETVGRESDSGEEV